MSKHHFAAGIGQLAHRAEGVCQVVFGRGVVLMMVKDPKGFHCKSSIILAKILRKRVSQEPEKTFRVWVGVNDKKLLTLLCRMRWWVDYRFLDEMARHWVYSSNS